MNPSAIRTMDRLAGVPICLVLTAMDRLFRAFRRGARSRPILQRILFVKMTEQGATVLAAPALQRAIELVGRSNVYFWVFEENREILELLDFVPSENIITVRSDSILGTLGSMLRTLLRIRRLKIDCTVDLELFSRASAILAYLGGARVRSGHHAFCGAGPYRGDLLTHRVQYNPHIHTADMYRVLVDALEQDPTELPLLKQACPSDKGGALPSFKPTAAELAQMRRKIADRTGHALEGPVVLLNPNASDMLPIRKWPMDRFRELGKRILEAYPKTTIVITGSAKEKAQACEIASSIGNPDHVVSLAGETTLRELLTLYGIADVLVTNDSGPAHFATMTDVNVIVLFGPETPLLYGPLGKHVTVITAALSCSPCVNAFNARKSPCSDNKCMQSISVAKVFSHVGDVLGHTKMDST